MNFRILLVALLLSLNVVSTYTSIDLEVPTRGKVYHPGNDQQFHEILSKFDLVVVDFYADWCGPCKQMHKVIEDLAVDRDCEDILFIKVNTDHHRSLSNHFNIHSLPTLMFFVDGQLILTLYGYQNKKDMKRHIANAFRIPKA